MTNDKHNYPLVLPRELWDKMDKTAKDCNVSSAEFIRRSIKLGLMSADLEKNPGDGLIQRKNGKDRKLKVFPRRNEDDDTIFLS